MRDVDSRDNRPNVPVIQIIIECDLTRRLTVFFFLVSKAHRRAPRSMPVRRCICCPHAKCARRARGMILHLYDNSILFESSNKRRGRTQSHRAPGAPHRALHARRLAPHRGAVLEQVGAGVVRAARRRVAQRLRHHGAEDRALRAGRGRALPLVACGAHA